MLIPALVYINQPDDPTTLKGWAIPSATDIAFSLGVLSLLGTKAIIVESFFNCSKLSMTQKNLNCFFIRKRENYVFFNVWSSCCFNLVK